MADSEDELLIATSCLLLATASRLSITLNLLSRRRRTVWVRNYLEKMNKYSVYQCSRIRILCFFQISKKHDFLHFLK